MKKLFDTIPNGQPRGYAPAAEQAMDIAIIGMAGRIAGAPDLDHFWTRLLDGTDFTAGLSGRRTKDIQDYLRYVGIATGSIRFLPASFLPEIDLFDHGFFNISLPEASVMSPEQRIFLETAWHTLEDAGYAGDKIRGSRTGIYIGFARENNAYLEMVKKCEPELAEMALTGNIASVTAGRVAHFLDLKGPAMLVNTACSSSLVALHQACQAIHCGDCEMALAGGIHIIIAPTRNANAQAAGNGIESASGIARPFDDSSDGTGAGEGSIALLLKPLNKALQDGDRIHAVIKGSAVNQDGRSINIAAPNSAAQEDVIVRAWKKAAIDPLTISYVESHGTGTPLGDPIEIAGLTAAFRHYTGNRQFCAIGAIKSNIGHLDGAAGLAGIVKAVLCLKNKTLAPGIHFEKPNRHIAFEDSPFFVNTRIMPWDNTKGVRRCGVSGFGISGTNAHIVLEESPAGSPTPNHKERKCLFPISATSLPALEKLAADYLCWLPATPYDLVDICYTAGTGRGHFSSRLAIIAHSKTELIEGLTAWTQGKHNEPGKQIFHCDISRLSGNIAGDQHIRELTRQAGQWITINPATGQDASFLEKLAALYVGGAAITWERVYRNEPHAIIPLPLYPFQPKRCWIDIPERIPRKQPKPVTPGRTAEMSLEKVALDEESIFSQFKAYFSKSFDVSSDTITRATNVYEIGLDSLTIVQVRLLIKKTYGIDIPVIDIFRKYMKIWDLSVYLSEQLKHRNASPATTQPSSAPTIEKQIISYRPDPRKIGKPVSAIRSTDIDRTTELTSPQQSWLDRFIRDYHARTNASLQYTRQHMPHFANNRNVSGFKKSYKQLHYTIIADRVEGSRIWDLDSNEYIDFAMGFGVSFMGHNHPIIREALERQLVKGAWLGPISPLAGEVAELICKIAGVERVAFYNSGTEAVMVAIRLARAATGRNKIVTFTGAYHGMFDGLLAQRNIHAEHYETVPLANGILQSMVDEVYVLEYDDPAALTFIEEQAHEIAAVLVEPVQSRKPELQPAQFLTDLRRVTAEKSICLLFDEIITGFRILPGGAQQYFNVKADLVTYGKVAGGGLPIGIVAGRSEFMMGIDGGIWDPGGDTLPRFDHRRTLVAGTFCHHPLALASAKAILQYIQQEGSTLYERLNRMTADFTRRLNDYFITANVPICIHNFGSMFQFRSDTDLKLFFYNLIHKGIYVWEGATFFISAVHSMSDLDRFESAIKECISDLQQAGMMQSRPATLPEQQGIQSRIIPLTNEQLKIWLKSQESPVSSALFNELIPSYLENLNEPALRKALDTLLERHEALRTLRISTDGLHIAEAKDRPLPIIQVNAIKDTPEAGKLFAQEWMRNELLRPFHPGRGFVKAFLIDYGKEKYIFGLIIHQLIADGHSLSLVRSEWQHLYESYCHDRPHGLPVPEKIETYLHLANQSPAGHLEKLRDFWSKEWETPTPGPFIRNPFAKADSYSQRWVNVTMPDKLYREVKTLAKNSQITPFAVLLAAHISTAAAMTGHQEIVTGIPSVGQLMLDNPCLVGQCMQMLPFRWNVQQEDITESLTGIRDKLNQLQDYRNFALADILDHSDASGIPCFPPDISMALNMDPPVRNRSAVTEIVGLTFQSGAGTMAKYDLFVNIVEVNKQLHFSFQYNSALFTDGEIRNWARTFFNLLANDIPAATEDNAPTPIPREPLSWTNVILASHAGAPGRVHWLDNQINFVDYFRESQEPRPRQFTENASDEEMLLSLLVGEHIGAAQLKFSVDSTDGTEEICLDNTIYFRQLADLADRIGFAAGTNIWLLPDHLLPAERIGWWWMALYRGWNLVISGRQPEDGDTVNKWIICGDKITLTSLRSYPESFHWHCAEWIMIGSEAVTNLHLNLLPFLGNDLKIHLITRVAGSPWYLFYHFLNYKPASPIRVMPAGQPLAASLVRLVDDIGQHAPPLGRGRLQITDSAGKKIRTKYDCSINGDGIFTIWSTGRPGITSRGFMFDEQLLIDAALSHPQIHSATLLRENTSADPGTISLQIEYKKEAGTLLDPLDYLKIFFPKNSLPGRVTSAESLSKLPAITSRVDAERAALLLNCVREVLKYPHAALRDSFPELGGSSIQAIHLVTLVRKRMAIDIQPAKLFTLPSLEHLLLPENWEEDHPAPIPPAGDLSSYPVTYTQKRFWITEGMEDGIRTSSLVEARRIFGDIAEPAFYNACLAVIDRHEILRTLFVTEDGEPVQKILPPGKDSFDYRFENLENEQDPVKKLQQLRDHEMQKPFSLDKSAAIRIRLFRIGPGQFATILATHHIIFDGWSFDVLMRDITTAYSNLQLGKSPFPRNLSIQFKDFSEWHNRLIKDKGDKFSRYREKKFGSWSKPLILAGSNHRPEFKQQEAGMVSLVFDRESTAALLRIGNCHAATMFMVAHSALLVLLHYYSDETDITIGTPVAHRNHPDLQDLIGSLINTVPIRTTFRSGDSFLELLSRVRIDALEAFEHEEYPFDLLLSDINYPRDPSRNPLFDIGFTYHEKTYLNDMPEVGQLGIRSEPLAGGTPGAMADLWFNCILDQQLLKFNIIYDQAIYSSGFMTTLAEDLSCILKVISFRPGIGLPELITRCKAVQIKRLSELQQLSNLKRYQTLRQIKAEATLNK